MRSVSWDEIPDEAVRAGVRRRGFGTKACLLVMNECEPGMDVRPHVHEFDQIAMIVSGRARYQVGDVANEMGPGSIVLVPAGATAGPTLRRWRHARTTSQTTSARIAIAAIRDQGTRSHHGAASGPWRGRSVALLSAAVSTGITISRAVGARATSSIGWSPRNGA